jgi:ABC-2 type transport system permease protein
VTRLVQVELVKLRTVSTLQLFAALAVALTLAGAITTLTSADFDRAEPIKSGQHFRLLGEPPPSAASANRQDAREAIAAWSWLPFVTLALGIIATGSERQHRTIADSARAVPRRWRLLAAKGIACGALAVALALIALAVNQAVALPWLDAESVSPHLSAVDWLLLVLGGVTASALTAVIGVAIGAFTPYPVTGITLALLFVLLLEPAVATRSEVVAEWLPGQTMAAAFKGFADLPGESVLPQGVGIAALGAWTGLAFALGGRYLERRDLV